MSFPAEIVNRKFAQATKTQTLSGSNTTVSTPLFKVTGNVRVTKLYAIVTTALGSNVTAAYWRTNDQTAQIAITVATGTTLSAAPAGSLLARVGLVGTALTLKSAAAGAVLDAIGAATAEPFMPFVVTQKTGNVETDIEFTYTTTNTPTSGVLQHYIEYECLSPDSAITVL